MTRFTQLCALAAGGVLVFACAGATQSQIAPKATEQADQAAGYTETRAQGTRPNNSPTDDMGDYDEVDDFRDDSRSDDLRE